MLFSHRFQFLLYFKQYTVFEIFLSSKTHVMVAHAHKHNFICVFHTRITEKNTENTHF